MQARPNPIDQLDETRLRGALVAARASENAARKLVAYIVHRLKAQAAERDAKARVERIMAERGVVGNDEPEYLVLHRERSTP
jgi:hypothetical protein